MNCVVLEEWRDVVGYEGLYKVSNLGNVKSLDRKRMGGKHLVTQKGRIIKQQLTTTGYRRVNLSVNATHKIFKVHRLVAFAFIGEPTKERNIINHKDGNPLNNNMNNLEWCNQSENITHAIETGLRKTFKMGKEELENLYYGEKMSCKQIAKLKGVPTYKIQNKMKKYKLKGRSTSETSNKYNLTYCFLREELKNKTQNELAKELGCHQSLITHTLKKYKRSGLL